MQWKVEDLAAQQPADEITNRNVRSLFMQTGRLVYFALHVKREEESIGCWIQVLFGETNCSLASTEQIETLTCLV
jgi:hypothetical protein